MARQYTAGTGPRSGSRGRWDRGPAGPQGGEEPAPLLLEPREGLDRGGRLGRAARELGVLGAPDPLAVALHRLQHQQVGHRLVVGEIAPRGAVGRHTKGTQAIGTPASDCRAFSVAAIQLSPSVRTAEAGRTRQRAASSTFGGTTCWSRRARAASISRRRTWITIASVVPRCSWVRS